MPTGIANPQFEVDLLSKSEYFPFGMKINELSFIPTWARYGYNGTHEQELAINPDGNHLDFGNFGYDTRVAMRRNIDPMFASYPHLSGFATFNNNPIYFNDPTGYEPNDGAVVYADKYVEPEASGGSDLGTGLVTLSATWSAIQLADEQLIMMQSDNQRNPAQDNQLTGGEIKILEENGVDIHELKENKKTGQKDLYKDKNGNIYVKPKGGRGPGEPTGIKIKGKVVTFP